MSVRVTETDWLKNRKDALEEIYRHKLTDRLSYVAGMAICTSEINNSIARWVSRLTNTISLDKYQENTLRDFLEYFKKFAKEYISIDIEATKKRGNKENEWVKKRVDALESSSRLNRPRDRMENAAYVAKCVEYIQDSVVGWHKWLESLQIMNEFDETTLSDFYTELKKLAVEFVEYDMKTEERDRMQKTTSNNVSTV